MPFFKPFEKVDYIIDVNNNVKTRIVDKFRYIAIDDDLIDQSGAYRYYTIQDGDRPDVVSHKLYGTPDYYWTLLAINQTKFSEGRQWPMSTTEFNQYINDVYSGVAVTARPRVIYNTDGQYIQTDNSVAGKFIEGEAVIGFLSGATGVVHGTDLETNQLIIKEVEGEFYKNEIIRGQTSLDDITSYQVFEYQLAPHHYVDAKGDTYSNALFFPEDGVSNSELSVITNREYEEAINDDMRNIRVIRPEHIEEFVVEYQKKLRGVS